MKFSYNWIKDYADVKMAPEALAEKLTMAGLEVGSIENKGTDYIFEVEVTSNRPDWLSIIGISREISAISNKKLLCQPEITSSGPKSKAAGPKKEISIQVENKKDCPLYTAKVIRNIKVGPSPDWLKKRLESIGCRSVNNVVDITNYILFTWGEPLHAFDLDKLASGSIFVRRAKDNEKIVTIDSQERILDKDTMIIADRDKPLAIAGIMGAKASEVGPATKNILLEAAIFEPIAIRRAARKLGLQSESSYRFERGIDPLSVAIASSQAVRLIKEICSGALESESHKGTIEKKTKTIQLEKEYLSRVLGKELELTKVRQILGHLGFKMLKANSKILNVGVPSFRQDIRQKIDLVEEIARIYGYNLIPETLPKVFPRPEVKTERDTVNKVKDILFGLGLSEAVTYSLVSRESLEKLASRDEQAIEVLNPLSKEQEVLRSSLIPGLLGAVAYNLNQKQEPIQLFEIANIFKEEGGLPEERLSLGIALCGRKDWLLGQTRVNEPFGFLDVKGILEVIFENTGIDNYIFKTESPAKVNIFINDKEAAVIRCLDKNALESFGVKNREVFIAELDLRALFSSMRQEKKFRSLPVYPGISRDISLVLKEEIALADILAEIMAQAKPLLKELKLIDVYRGKQIPQGFKGLTISCLYRSDQRTLTEEEIAPLHNAAAKVLTEKFACQIR